MGLLQNKRVLLGVSGGIAAYKACELVRRLGDAGAEVRVVMTKGALAFVSELSFQAVSGNPVHTELLDHRAEAGMGHIELARWADLILIAPASANTISRLAQGNASDLLSTLCLASDAPLYLAPAMNRLMWDNAATQANIQTLRSRAVSMIGPASGSQACGEVGQGRMVEPQGIVDELNTIATPGLLAGKKLVITAGPTREAIDPVRYLSNYSSGKMGFALAKACQAAGAECTLIAGPVDLATPSGVKRIDVTSCEQMYQASLQQSKDCDLFIASAAVADYRVDQPAEQKIKKAGLKLQLNLVENPDIVASIAKQKGLTKVVGFAAESENLLEYARTKLEKKGLDLIIANDIAEPGIGFAADANEVWVLSEHKQTKIAKAGKEQIAHQLVPYLAALFV